MQTTGLSELEILSFDWKTAAPGMFSTLCCASGTCDNYMPKKDKNTEIQRTITIAFDERNAHSIKIIFGTLR